jgi:hypothetical protein
MRQAHHYDLAIDKKFGIDGVAVARGDTVPQVRKPAFVDMPGELGSHFEGAYKLFHGASVC